MKNKKILVLTYCGKKKLQGVHKAKDIYLSNRIKAVRKICEKFNLSFGIVSAKYGIIDGEKEIEAYEKILENEEEVNILVPTSVENLKQINPDLVIFFGAAKMYRLLVKKSCDILKIPVEFYGFGIMGGFKDFINRLKQIKNKENI